MDEGLTTGVIAAPVPGRKAGDTGRSSAQASFDSIGPPAATVVRKHRGIPVTYRWLAGLTACPHVPAMKCLIAQADSGALRRSIPPFRRFRSVGSIE